MIQANELRLGNWLQDSKGRFYQVNIDDLVYISEVGTKSKPIPLTEEWKINFGVVKRGVEWRFNLGESSICFEETPEGFFYTGGEGVNLSRNIEFVHDFQNIVYAIEGIEIQINQSAK